MSTAFFEQPILNSPYEPPARHWALEDGNPTGAIIESRRECDLITPVPKPKKRKGGKKGAAASASQAEMVLASAGDELSSEDQEYNPRPIVNELRGHLETWRALPNPDQWQVTPETARLLQHWRHHPFAGVRPFFCQIEAVETAIWLTEVAPRFGPRGAKFLKHLEGANAGANPDLMRLALKLATGAGKTTVMAMLIAWQTVNAVRHPGSNRFSRGFLIVTPGITIRDRLRVLLPNDDQSYYHTRELVPPDLLSDIDRARIVITNYHAFRLRERLDVAKGTRALIKGRGPALQTTESDGQMLQRVMPELMGLKNIVVLNDEAHHCYRERPDTDEEAALKGEDKEEAKKNNEAARLWITGIEAVKRRLGVRRVFDLSATPFFLRGSGYVEGTLFPWTMSDFSLMDAIECGIVKLPRVPVSDNIPGQDSPIYRNLWDHIGKQMPKKGRRKSADALDPLNLPAPLQTALEALYGHYVAEFEDWDEAGIEVPPVFIVVCNNTASSKLVYDFISGFHRTGEDGNTTFHQGRLELFRNFDQHGNRLAKPNTLLIDSEQLESGEALDRAFREAAAPEIEQYRRELVARTGDQRAGENITESELLREAMNTVGRAGRLGGDVRCVVSVSMLTEGWDANTVRYILGVRAFGTQLLCEQVVGRALRRQSYDLNPDSGLLDVEYADVLGIPFDFTARPMPAKRTPPRETVHVQALPERAALEIRFPRVQGYRVDLPSERFEVAFNDDSRLVLTPELVGPTKVRNEGIVGEGVTFSLDHLDELRPSTIVFHLTRHLLFEVYRDANEEPKLHLFGQLKRIVRQWLDGWLECKGGTFPGQLLYKQIAAMAAERIKAAVTASLQQQEGARPVRAILDPYNPSGSTRFVNFTTSRETRWNTAPHRSHVNWVIGDSDWEIELARVVEEHPRVRAYVKNQNLGLEVPYLMGSIARTYIPDFIVQVDDGFGKEDPLNLIVEIKGFRGEDAKDKANTMKSYWIPGVNALGSHGRWAFAEFTDVWEIESGFAKLIENLIEKEVA